MSRIAGGLRWLAISLSLIAIHGCALVPGDATPTSAPGGERSPMREGLRDYKVTFHCHCYLSHDSEGTVEEITAAANAQGFNAVLLTDHYEPGNMGKSARGLRDGVLFTAGVETRLDGSKGSILSSGLSKEIQTTDRASLPALLSARGAFVAAGHVEQIAEGYDLSAFHGFEVYNLHAEFMAASKAGLAARLLTQTRDTFLESTLSNPDANLARWDRELAKGLRLAAVSGHDAHNNIQVLGLVLGTYSELFRLFSTRVLAHELTERSIMQALRIGRTYVAFDWLGDPAGFVFRCRAGSQTVIVGGTLRWNTGATLEVRLPKSAEIRVLRDGKPLLKRQGRSIDTPLSEGGVYRVEAYRDGRLWIVSSPIYVLDKT